MEATNPPKNLSSEEKKDVVLASSLVITPLLSDQGLPALEEVIKGAGQDLPGAIAHAIFPALSNVKGALDMRGLPISDKAWAANGGVVDRIVQDICDAVSGIMGVQEASDPNFMMQVREELIELMRQDDSGQQPPPQEEISEGEATSLRGIPQQADQQTPAQPRGLLAQMRGM